MLRFRVLILLGDPVRRAMLAAIPLLLTAGCASGTVSTTPVNGQPAATGGASSAPASAAPKKAHLGDTIDLKGMKAADRIQVTLVKIVDPDTSNDGFSSPPTGDRYVSVQFRIVNTGTGTYQDDPMIDISAKDATGQDLKTDIMTSTSAGAQLSSSVNLAPGDKALGFITFDVPDGVKIAQVQYALNGGMFGNSGEWTVG